jgi:hypothetical protein
VVVAALSNGGGEKRWATLVKLADHLVKLSGKEEGLPSQMVKHIEDELKLDLGKDLFGKISNVAFAVGDILNAPIKKTVKKGPGFESVSIAPEVPLVGLVQFTDEATAKKMVEDVLPHLCGLLSGGKAGKPESKEKNGHQVYSLKLGPREALHYGRHGNTLVLGPHADPVAQSLAAGANKKGWLANEKSAARIKELNEPLALVVARPVSGILAGLMMPVHGSGKGGEIKKSGKEAGPPPGGKEGGIQVEVVDVAPSKEFAQVKKELEKLLAKEEPLVLSITRKDDRLQEEIKIGGLKPLVAKLTDLLIEHHLQAQAQRIEALEKQGK